MQQETLKRKISACVNTKEEMLCFDWIGRIKL